MVDFFMATENLPFTIALGLMVGIGLLEGFTTLLGFGIFSFIDSLVPDVNLDVDVNILGWFHLGQVPILVLLVLFLFSFGTIGLIFQSIAQNTVGLMLPWMVASVGAIVVAMGFVRIACWALAKIIPKDETEAVSESSFIGRVAVVTIGTAKRGRPTQAKLRDEYGQTHYVMVEPDSDHDTFGVRSNVLLVKRAGAIFYAIPNPSDALVDQSD
jgi:hypothetical protein